MSINHNNSKENNKDFDNDNAKYWSYYCLVNNMFNNLMSPDNKYIIQSITKLPYFRIRSPVTCFDIHNDFKDDTNKEIELYVKDCKSQEQAYRKLDGLISEIIAQIYKETEPLILSTIEYEDPVWVKRSINEIRTCVSKNWEVV